MDMTQSSSSDLGQLKCGATYGECSTLCKPFPQIRPSSPETQQLTSSCVMYPIMNECMHVTILTMAFYESGILGSSVSWFPKSAHIQRD